MQCPGCQHENPPGQKFCGECGVPLQGSSERVLPAWSYADLQRSLTETLEQQTATAAILRIISASPTNLQTVLDAVAESAARLCDARAALILRVVPGGTRAVANYGPIPALSPDQMRPHARTPSDRATLERRTIHVEDLASALDEYSDAKDFVERFGVRTVMATPLVRAGQAIGVIMIRRTEVRPFSNQQIALLETFADQAVIAIENARLFNETKEALEQQTATAETLRVISGSPTDLQPVFDTVAESAARLCNSLDAHIFRRDGDLLRLVGYHGSIPTLFTLPLVRGTANGRAVLDGRTVHIVDMQTQVDEFPEGSENARRMGHRTVLNVPLMREGVAIGTIGLRRTEARLFTERQVALLQTFADQAVIAIENVRLFKELEEKNRALTTAHAQMSEALDQQTATSEILRVISSSPTDLQPVFTAIVHSAGRLCDATHGGLLLFDGERITLETHYGLSPEDVAVQRRVFPMLPDRGSGVGRAVLSRATVHIEDIRSDPDFQVALTKTQESFRTCLVVPMLRGDAAVGAIGLWRREVRPFSQTQIDMVQAFASQAVIAIENVRLFKELEARTADLTRSVEQLTALGEVGRAVSSTLDLETVLSTIVSRAVQLSGLDGGVVFEYDESAEEFVQRAMTETGEALAEVRRATRIRKGEGVLGRTAITLEPVQVADIAMPGAYEGRLREILIDSGIRAILAVPMVREGHLIGCLGVTRNSPGEFPAATIELLRTFATQSALAIQNARLFREIADKSHQLEVASQHKSEFLANMSHELRTPLNAIIGFSEVLSERMFGNLNEKQEEYLKDIHASGTHLLSLINDILDLSKIEAGRMELELTDFDLPTAIDNALMLVRERAGRRSITLHAAVDARLGQVQADERKVRQVVLNLLSNAIKFTPEGGRIEVRALPVDAAVEVSVSDTGVGIAPEDQEAVFEEFRQVGTADKKAEGTGLGLTLCRKFVELHGGKIWVKSEVGVGSTFTFSIPLSNS